MNKQSRRLELALILAITLVAFGLRLWQLNATPPGWRDDEIINSLVISQHVLDGEWAVYYADASGHEALYHILNAAFLSLFGATVWGIRYLSVLLGTLTVPLTYLLGKKLFGSTVGLVAAAGLAVSFWALMYSRIGLRHILMPPLTLAAFYFFWRGLETKNQRIKIKDWWSAFNLQSLIFKSPIFNFSVSAIFMGLGFYTYFASRGVPLILGAFLVYATLVAWPLVKSKWRGLIWLFVLAVILAIPLLLTLQQQPESEARVAELAVPLVAAGAGDFAPLMEHVLLTLGMFANNGDGEWLYNIPNRPVLTTIGAVFFWLGVAITAVFTLIPLWHKLRQWLQKQPTRPTQHIELASAFLLLWWLAGISPAFISVPPASLGHTILAQPAVFILAAVPIGLLKIKDLRLAARWQVIRVRFTYLKTSRRLSLSKAEAVAATTSTGSVSACRSFKQMNHTQVIITVALSLLLIFSIAARDWPDYFVNWPARGMVRFLYRADLHELADYVNKNESLTNFGINSLLAGPWDQIAFANDLRHENTHPRWFNAERAMILNPNSSFTGYPKTAVAYPDTFHPTDQTVAGYTLNQIDYTQSNDEPVCFENGLCLQTAVYNPEPHTLDLTWQVGRDLDLPAREIISNPPPPGIYAGSRLLVFAQLLDSEGNFLVGDDGLWVDIYSLQSGDVFKQQHRFVLPEGVEGETAVFGLYDPMTGIRILAKTGQDHVKLALP